MKTFLSLIVAHIYDEAADTYKYCSEIDVVSSARRVQLEWQLS